MAKALPEAGPSVLVSVRLPMQLVELVDWVVENSERGKLEQSYKSRSDVVRDATWLHLQNLESQLKETPPTAKAAIYLLGKQLEQEDTFRQLETISAKLAGVVKTYISEGELERAADKLLEFWSGITALPDKYWRKRLKKGLGGDKTLKENSDALAKYHVILADIFS